MTDHHEEEPRPEYPNNKDELLRDFTVAGRLKEIRDAIQLKDRLAPKWWEAVVGIVQFAAALGLLASIVQDPPLRAAPMGRLLVLWLILLVISLIFGFEFLIFRIHHLRRAFEISLKQIDHLGQRIEALEHALKKNTENDTEKKSPRHDQ
jgi:hypothetical protein